MENKKARIVPDLANMSHLRAHGKDKTKRKLTDRENLLILKEKHDAMVAGIAAMNEEDTKLRERIEWLEATLVNAQKAVDIHKQIMIDSLTKHNEDKQNLERELKEVKFGKQTAAGRR